MSRIFFADLPIDRVSIKTIVPELVGLVKEARKRPYFVTYLNAHCANLALKNQKYRQILKKADLVYADGFGIVLAARVFGYKLPGRLTAKDFFDEFCKRAEREGNTIYFLGGERGVAEKMTKTLKEKYPRLKILGNHHGCFGKSDEKEIIRQVNILKPDFLLVGMGVPKQEQWLKKNLVHLKVKVGWCVGGLFDFVSGEKPKCPWWLGDLGFEWLFRLITEPKRLWKRYLIELPSFGYTLMRLKFKKAI
ncbi:WecB/TagA/CpsF family glycosyltransferase [Candidatus Microgenomates bacterium]|nr:WecB/TagA/CpsF family glycosyltransferase [Candidatus Microgenomates bacterium]